MGYRSVHWIGLAMCIALAATLCGCVPGPQFTGDGAYAANTSKSFRENRVYYLERPHSRWLASPPDGPDECRSFRRLLPVYQPPVNTDDVIPRNSALTVLVSSVRIPESVQGPLDIAVVLDIFTGPDPKEQLSSLVVWYQRDVVGGMTLAFQNLVVYSADHWNADSPPLFRLRLVDVKAERNSATVSLLKQSEQVANTFSGVIPSAALPIVSIATKAAALILGNQQNQVILDYTVQFFSGGFVDSVDGRSDVASLQRGAWLVVGLPMGQTSRFWRADMVYDRQTQELFDERAVPRSDPYGSVAWVPGLQTPYITMTIAPYSAQVYGLVQQRSEALTRLLSLRSSQNAGDVTELSAQLAKGVKTFVLIRTLRDQRSRDAVDRVMDALKLNKAAYDEDALRDELSRVWPVGSTGVLDDFNTAYTWWQANRSNLTFDAEKYRLVFKPGTSPVTPAPPAAGSSGSGNQPAPGNTPTPSGTGGNHP